MRVKDCIGRLDALRGIRRKQTQHAQRIVHRGPHRVVYPRTLQPGARPSIFRAGLGIDQSIVRSADDQRAVARDHQLAVL